MRKLKDGLEKIILPVQTKLVKVISIVISLFIMIPQHYASAATNYGENFGKYALDQLFWVAIVIIALGLIGCIVKRNMVGIIGCIVIGVVVVGFMGDPDGIKSVGQDLWGTIKG